MMLMMTFQTGHLSADEENDLLERVFAALEDYGISLVKLERGPSDTR